MNHKLYKYNEKTIADMLANVREKKTEQITSKLSSALIASTEGEL